MIQGWYASNQDSQIQNVQFPHFQIYYKNHIYSLIRNIKSKLIIINAKIDIKINVLLKYV